MKPKYPIKVKLHPNASDWCILGATATALEMAKVSDAEISDYLERATERGYKRLWEVTRETVEVVNE